jgi:hypothetical protein
MKLAALGDSVNTPRRAYKLLQLRTKFGRRNLKLFYINNILRHSINVAVRETLCHFRNN